ncbi:MAG: nucleotide exchange factor GrpE [Treponema sp.]|nr:nucleotide exchange factor GrpE [Treponema sp.]MEE3434811.1 nucleotide exchange factor GrpE [Treponema sp.]
MEEKEEEKEREEVQENAQNGEETQENAGPSSKEDGEADSAQAAEESSAEEEKEPTPEEKIAALEKENADLKDQLLRRAADFDNYRKRTIKEKQDAYDYANTALLQDLLDSLDNLDRTVEAAEKADDPKAIADGVKIISSSLISMLESKYNLTAFGQAGEDFNPDMHEAIGSCQDEVEKPVLKEVYLKGYKLKDRVIRNAKVMVTMPKDK